MKKDKNEKGGTPPKDPWYDKEKALKFVDDLFKAAGIDYEVKNIEKLKLDFGEFNIMVRCKDGKKPEDIGIYYDSIGDPGPGGGEFSPTYGFEIGLEVPFIIMALNEEYISDNLALREVLEDIIKRFEYKFDYYKTGVFTSGSLSNDMEKIREHFRLTMVFFRKFHELSTPAQARIGIISRGVRIQHQFSAADGCRSCGEIFTISRIHKRKPPEYCPKCSKSMIQFLVDDPILPIPGARSKIALKKLKELKDYKA